jgi:hypothetical protein
VVTVIMTGFPFALRAAARGRGPGRGSRRAGWPGSRRGEHEGRQVLAAEPGGLVHAVAAVVMAKG